MLHSPLIDGLFEMIGWTFVVYQLAHLWFFRKFKKKHLRKSNRSRVQMTRLK